MKIIKSKFDHEFFMLINVFKVFHHPLGSLHCHQYGQSKGSLKKCTNGVQQRRSSHFQDSHGSLYVVFVFRLLRILVGLFFFVVFVFGRSRFLVVFGFSRLRFWPSSFLV